MADCHGLMRPEGVRQHSQKGWQIIHICVVCGFERVNIVADDDDFDEICKIMTSGG